MLTESVFGTPVRRYEPSQYFTAEFPLSPGLRDTKPGSHRSSIEAEGVLPWLSSDSENTAGLGSSFSSSVALCALVSTVCLGKNAREAAHPTPIASTTTRTPRMTVRTVVLFCIYASSSCAPKARPWATGAPFGDSSSGGAGGPALLRPLAPPPRKCESQETHESFTSGHFGHTCPGHPVSVRENARLVAIRLDQKRRKLVE